MGRCSLYPILMKLKGTISVPAGGSNRYLIMYDWFANPGALDRSKTNG